MVNYNGNAALARAANDPEVVALDGGATITEAARTMAAHTIGSVGVLERGALVGLVTERDLVVSVLARGGHAARPMREAMRPGIPRVGVRAGEDACAALMRQHATRHLLVEDGGQVVGVVSMTDVIQRMLAEKQFLIEQLNVYINGR
jgi:CBS domain-containing protein